MTSKKDRKAKKTTIGAIATTDSSVMNIKCSGLIIPAYHYWNIFLVIFCKECENKDSACPGRGNAQIIAEENSSRRSMRIENRNSVSQDIPVSAPENPVTISMGGIEFVSFYIFKKI